MKKLFVLSGGIGKEREVSLSSGRNVCRLLKEGNIQYESIIVQDDRSWKYKDQTVTQEEGILILREENALVFQVIHGTYGEDGELANLLEEAGVSCVGSYSDVMKLTIDKHITEKKLQEHAIRTTVSIAAGNGFDIERIEIGFPAMVKPKDEGSSVALYKVNNKQELQRVLEESIPLHGVMLVQEFVVGREFTCGVVEIDGKTLALLPTEIILTKGETFDYAAKYTIGGSREITPAEVDATIIKKIQDSALQVHAICGCKDISRTDMILQADGELVVLEINTIPGMTETSFIPAQLAVSGHSVTDFIKGMLEKYS